MLKKISLTLFSIATLVFATAAPVQAQGFLGGLFGGGSSTGSNVQCKTHLIPCSEPGAAAINDLIRIALIVMSTLIGVVAIGALAYAGALYASAQDDKEKVGRAIKLVRQVVIGLLMYIFTIAIINWLIPTSVIEQPPASSPTVSPTASPTSTLTPTPSPTTTP